MKNQPLINGGTMKRHITPLAITALLVTGCSATMEAEPAPTTEPTVTTSPTPSPTPEPTPEPTTEAPSPEPTQEATIEAADTKAEAEDQLTDALTPPVPDPVEAFDPEASFLATYKQELQTLPEGPHMQLGTDLDAINLGYQACSDLGVMSYGEALVMYAFSEATEEQVADYNAALNAAPGTLC